MASDQHLGLAWAYLVDRCRAAPDGRIRMRPDMRAAVLQVQAELDAARSEAERWKREAAADRAALAAYRKRWPAPADAHPEDGDAYTT